MTSEAPMTTVDSLVKFQFKKRFSFTNRSGADAVQVSNESSSEESEHKWKPKGSAKLRKNSSNESNFSDSSEMSSHKKKKSHKKEKKIKKNKNRYEDENSDEDDDDDDEEKEKRERNLNKLYRMFPHNSSERIKKLFQKNGYNAKKCIDILLKENEKDNKDDEEESDQIEEWSDGDEKIRAKNVELKNARSSNESVASVKRKMQLHSDEELKEPKNKRIKKIVLDSDDDDEEVDRASKVSTNSTKSTKSSSSSLNSSKESVEVKKKKKKVILKGSSDESGQEVKAEHSKKHQKEKKSEKKKKKKSNKRSDSENDDNQEDDDFMKDDASEDSDDSGCSDKINEDQKEKIVNMFNTATFEEFQSIFNTTQARLKKLIELRPYKSFRDLNSRLTANSLKKSIMDANDIIYARQVVTELLTKCETISNKMEALVSKLINSEENVSLLEIKAQPKMLNKALSLKPYQLIGLNWLRLLHQENINGILADEMGLGKTCQTISFLAYLKEIKVKNMHLIVVPPSTLDNWVREISVWLPCFNFTVYQGSLEERKHLRFDILNKKFEKPLDAIVTTYGLLSSTNEDKAFFRKLHFEYCVYDEAHMLKNMNSIRYQSLIKINSRHRLLLTGTPLQNNLVELMSLLYFVMPNIFHHKTQYVNKLFTASTSSSTDKFYNDKIAKAKGIMKPFILRRLKADVLKQLPDKKEEIIYCDMIQRQEKQYSELITYYKKRKNELLEEAVRKAEELKLQKEKEKSKQKPNPLEEIYDIMDNGSNKKKSKGDKKERESEDSSSNIIMELRKIANHPLLTRKLYDDEKLKKMAKLVLKESSPDTVYEYVLEDMSVLNDFQIHKLCPLYNCLKGYELDDQAILSSGKFIILDSLLQEKKEMGNRVLIFSQFVIMLDILEEFLRIKSYKFLRLDGSTPVNERIDLIDNFNNDNEIFVFLLSTKAGGLGINLTAANVVVMHDIDYNPFNDKQAEDRCHRVGQTKEVQVYKLISKDTIDESMLKIQQNKLELGNDLNGQSDENQSKVDMVSLLKEALKV